MLDRLSILVAGLVLFSIVHSVLAAGWVREPAIRLLGGRTERYRVLYNLVALALLGATLLVTGGDYPLVWRTHGVLRATLLGVQALALAGFLLTVRSFNLREFAGVEAAPPGGMGGMGGRLQTGGMYGLCRHPLYFFTSLFFSAWPTMNLKWLIFAVWLWAYSYLGSIFEERKLLRAFGAAYARYRATHARLLPLGWRSAGDHQA
jgi:protein-S-isoprenylcysteine O-methyltransferase Ste14